MKSSCTKRLRIASAMGAILLSATLCDTGALAQDELRVHMLTAPPPMKFLPGTERTQLSGNQDPKSRVKTSLALAEVRLLRAEQFTVDQTFIMATTELGIYQAIIEDVLRFLSQQKTDSNKTRDLYKRLEIQLRLYGIRIEKMRRVTPAAYAVHLIAVWEFSDLARARALNAFFNDTVVPPRATDIEKTSGFEATPGTRPNPPDRQK